MLRFYRKTLSLKLLQFSVILPLRIFCGPRWLYFATASAVVVVAAVIIVKGHFPDGPFRQHAGTARVDILFLYRHSLSQHRIFMPLLRFVIFCSSPFFTPTFLFAAVVVCCWGQQTLGSAELQKSAIALLAFGSVVLCGLS